jgi:uncharacterized protein
MYQRVRQRGYQVFAVNPHATEVEGDRCCRDLKSIPGGVEAVVIGTRPEIAGSTVRECAELGIEHVWMHRSVGAGSVSKAAAEYGRERGMSVIDGGVPADVRPVRRSHSQSDARDSHDDGQRPEEGVNGSVGGSRRNDGFTKENAI